MKFTPLPELFRVTRSGHPCGTFLTRDITACYGHLSFTEGVRAMVGSMIGGTMGRHLLSGPITQYSDGTFILLPCHKDGERCRGSKSGRVITYGVTPAVIA